MQKLTTAYKNGSTWRVQNGKFHFDGKGAPARTQTGYGSKIRTNYRVEIPVKNTAGLQYNKLYNVYALQYSNSATLYIQSRGRIYILDNTFQD